MLGATTTATGNMENAVGKKIKQSANQKREKIDKGPMLESWSFNEDFPTVHGEIESSTVESQWKPLNYSILSFPNLTLEEGEQENETEMAVSAIFNSQIPTPADSINLLASPSVTKTNNRQKKQCKAGKRLDQVVIDSSKSGCSLKMNNSSIGQNLVIGSGNVMVNDSVQVQQIIKKKRAPRKDKGVPRKRVSNIYLLV